MSCFERDSCTTTSRPCCRFQETATPAHGPGRVVCSQLLTDRGSSAMHKKPRELELLRSPLHNNEIKPVEHRGRGATEWHGGTAVT